MTDFSSQAQIKPEQIIELVLRYKWIILIFMSISLSVGLVKTLMSTRIYEATTQILVQPQKVPQTFVRSVVSTGIEARISTISQQIMSRSNLEKIIDQFGLFLENEDMYLEDKIIDLRRRIDVDITQSRYGSEGFIIRYQGSDPERVMRITNTLASYFMDENLKVREAQAVGTSEFLDVELEKTRKKLELREKKLADYRARYLGGLPDELESNLRTLDRLQKQLSSRQGMLRDVKNNISLLKNQIASQKELESKSFENFSAFGEEELEEETEEKKKLNKLQESYESLLLKYTEKHPDALKLKSRIDKLKKSIEEKKKKSVATKKTGKEEESLFSEDFAEMQFQSQLSQLEKELSKVTKAIKSTEKKMDFYQKRVEETPKREQELQALQRDYKNIQSVYKSLLDRKLEAEISVNMEKKQKGEQFRILDHARKPEKPISPNVKKSLTLYFVAGLALSGGLCFLLFIFDDSIRHNDEIEKKFGIPILAEIAQIKSEKLKKKEKFKLVLFAIASSYTLFITGVFVFLYLEGIDRAIDMIKSYL